MELKSTLTFALVFISGAVSAQTNTFPTSGNVGVGTENPVQKMTIKSPGTLSGTSSTDYDFAITDEAPFRLQLLGLVNTVGDYGLFQVIIGGIGAGNLVLQTQGGNVGIGTTTPAEKLSVNGNIRAKEIKVEIANWPDYVFADDYNYMTLQETDKYIKKNKHLPEMPTSLEVNNGGVELGIMNKLLLKKIEEMTLHLIEKDEQMRASALKIADLDKEIQAVKHLLMNKQSKYPKQ